MNKKMSLLLLICTTCFGLCFADTVSARQSEQADKPAKSDNDTDDSERESTPDKKANVGQESGNTDRQDKESSKNKDDRKADSENKKAKQEEEKKTPDTKIHHLSPSGTYVDFLGATQLDIQSIIMAAGKQKSFYRLCDHLDKLAEDKEIKHIVIDLSAAVSFNPAQLDELTRRLNRLKASDKKLYAWLENASDVHLAIAAACDEVIMADFGGADLPSMSMGSMFYKDAMDLVGVTASVVRAGDFKGAVEPYLNSQMSTHLREHYLKMLKSINNAAVSRIARGRGLSRDDVRELQAKRFLLPQEALDAGLVDRLVPYGAMQETIDEMVGGPTKWVTPKSSKKDVSIFDLFSSSSARDAIKENTIAVMHLSGAITDGTEEGQGIVSGPTVKAIESILENKRIKGVVVRINSPGGSATASEAVRQALVKLAAEKPVVISMGEMAASGGYWVTCIDAPVYAERGTITGSIGVFALKLSFGQLMRRVGVQQETITLDESAAAFSIDRPWSEKDSALLQDSIDHVYSRFLKLVSRSRSIPVKRVRPIAGGRVWSGTQAKSLGLVDEIGGLDDCLKVVAKLAELDDYNVIHRPKVTQGFDLSSLFGNEDEILNDVLSVSAIRILNRSLDSGVARTILNDAMNQNGARPTIWLLNDAAIKVR